MEKEFNLSKEMKKDIQIGEHILHCEVFEKTDVKEFIKQLKEEINKDNGDRFTRNCYECGREFSQHSLLDFINKLAGEDLI